MTVEAWIPAGLGPPTPSWGCNTAPMVRILRSMRCTTALRPANRSGFSLIEVIVLLAVLGVLLGIGVTMFQPASARLLANDVKSQFQQARFEAVKRNQPVAVVWDADARQFETRIAADPALNADVCQGAIVLNRKSASEYRAVTVATTMGPGLVWLPNGQARTCGGGLNVESTTTISDPNTERRVVVSLAGRVAVE